MSYSVRGRASCGRDGMFEHCLSTIARPSCEMNSASSPNVDGRHALVEIARHGHGEEVAHPQRHEQLQLQPPPSGLHLPRMGDESQPLLRKLVNGEHQVLCRHPGDDDERRQRAEHTAPARLCQAREGEEIVVGAAGEAASVGAAALQDAAPAAGLPALDPGGVPRPREVNVCLAFPLL